MRRVVLRVDSVVLRGIRVGDQKAFADGMHRELARIFAQPGRLSDPGDGAGSARVRVKPVRIRPGATDTGIGRIVARSIGGALGR